MSTTYDLQSATSVLPSDDLTVASAWASSPLGDPAIEDGFLSASPDSDYDPPARPSSTLRSAGRNAVLAAAVVGAIGAVAGVGLLAIGGIGSSQLKPAVVIPNSSVGSVAPQPPAAPPSTVAPAPAPVVSPSDPGQGPAVAVGPTNGGAVAAPSDPTPPVAGPPAPADPGTPPVDTPSAPPVIVNIPPVVPLPIPIPVHPSGPGNGNSGNGNSGNGNPGNGNPGNGKPGGGKPSGGLQTPVGPTECIACHAPLLPVTKK